VSEYCVNYGVSEPMKLLTFMQQKISISNLCGGLLSSWACNYFAMGNLYGFPRWVSFLLPLLDLTQTVNSLLNVN
jgi:hypothetical protein